MKLTTKTDHYNFEIELGEDLSTSAILTAVTEAIWHIGIQTIARFARVEEEAKEMSEFLLLHQSALYDKFFEENFFADYHKQHENDDLYRTMRTAFNRWISTNHIDIADFKNRYTDAVAFRLDVHAEDSNTVHVDIADDNNRDTLFTYTAQAMKDENFEISAFVDLMCLVVLGEELFGDINPLQKTLPEDYFRFCTEALEQF